MSVPTARFRAEHAHLLPHVEALAAAADALDAADPAERVALVDGALAFLAGHLIPHARAEDEVLYPEVDRLVGSGHGTNATDTMRRDHAEVARLVDRLRLLRDELAAGDASPLAAREARRVLYGLHAVVALHFAKEEEVYLPLLDRTLDAAAAAALHTRMERAAREVGDVATAA